MQYLKKKYVIKLMVEYATKRFNKIWPIWTRSHKNKGKTTSMLFILNRCVGKSSTFVNKKNYTTVNSYYYKGFEIEIYSSNGYSTTISEHKWRVATWWLGQLGRPFCCLYEGLHIFIFSHDIILQSVLQRPIFLHHLCCLC